MDSLARFRIELQRFAEKRDWDKFHSPKNLAMALSVEVSELVEHFQWLSEEQSLQLDLNTRTEIADEIADIQIYLIRLADKLEINIEKAVDLKLSKNAAKYHVNKVYGSAKKYSDYEQGKDI